MFVGERTFEWVSFFASRALNGHNKADHEIYSAVIPGFSHTNFRTIKMGSATAEAFGQTGRENGNGEVPIQFQLLAGFEGAARGFLTRP